MAKLVLFEVRQALDTKASLLTAVLAAVVTSFLSFLALRDNANVQDIVAADVLGAMILTVPLALALLVVLSVTSEWRYRTMTVALPLVRSRGGFYVAKVLAMLLLSTVLFCLAVFFLSVVLGMVGLSGSRRVDWSGYAPRVALGFAVSWLATVFGFGFAASLRSFPLSLFAILAVTIIWNVVSTSLLGDDRGYLSSLTPLSATETGVTISTAGPLFTSILIWYVTPVLIGAWRFNREEF